MATPEDVVRIATAALPATPVAMDWTQAGDGVLVADGDGSVTMWLLRCDAPAAANPAKPASAAAKQAAEAMPALSAAWHADAKQSQVTVTRHAVDVSDARLYAGRRQSGIAAIGGCMLPGHASAVLYRPASHSLPGCSYIDRFRMHMTPSILGHGPSTESVLLLLLLAEPDCPAAAAAVSRLRCVVPCGVISRRRRPARHRLVATQGHAGEQLSKTQLPDLARHVVRDPQPAACSPRCRAQADLRRCICMPMRRPALGVNCSDPAAARTRNCAACRQEVRAERLRHPSGVFGLQWSPSGLQQGAPQYEHLQVRSIPAVSTTIPGVAATLRPAAAGMQCFATYAYRMHCQAWARRPGIGGVSPCLRTQRSQRSQKREWRAFVHSRRSGARRLLRWTMRRAPCRRATRRC